MGVSYELGAVGGSVLAGGPGGDDCLLRRRRSVVFAAGIRQRLGQGPGMGRRPDEGPGPSYYIGPFITCLVATIATAMLAVATGSDTVAEGISLGLVTGVGLVGSALFVTGFFDPKKPQPMVWFAVTGSYHLVGLLVASVIVSVWKGA